MAFVYHRINPSGYMDQTLEIVNNGPSAVIPTVEITPVDRTGTVLPGVTVSTAYGTDQGKMVVPARETSLDVLAFAGRDAANVADVRVTVRKTADVTFPAAPQIVEAQAVNEAGQPTAKFGPFDAVVLTNPNSEKVSVGVVCIIWEQPPAGQPQQARTVIPIGAATIAGQHSATVRASGDARNGCGSLKTYFSPPT
ncbi:hypothetical protein [Planosporangium mesophilum]|uniref:Uncharacterized protein n=1 Tax=Planosporangium mesophilum TaxID=689768 RepID=A0A8J3TG08_9ACTN|nr:hypothetical protein [Planosporangium mesophilum]NJC86834.1 hypothetical protein [Planosporangium mesophilum]GII26470.1 hypothetical protein Pme01_60670 [Planosporangium mesophilum]